MRLRFSTGEKNEDLIGSLPSAPQQSKVQGFPSISLYFDEKYATTSGIQYGSLGCFYAASPRYNHALALIFTQPSVFFARHVVGFKRSAASGGKLCLVTVGSRIFETQIIND